MVDEKLRYKSARDVVENGPRDIWHPGKSRWIKRDGKLTDFGISYYEEIAKEADARSRAEAVINKYRTKE